MIVKSAAKLNLTLDILGLLPGDYHAIETVFQNIDILDTLEFFFKQEDGDDDICTAIELLDSAGATAFPLDGDNLIAKAAKAFALMSGLGKGLTVRVAVHKTIPIAAGLAGGSGNAAATLVALNEHFKKPLSKNQLSEIAATLGSDISFFIYGGTCAGRGRGELLESIKHPLDLSFFIVKPRDIAISTPWIYREYDNLMGNQKDHVIQSKLADCEIALKSGNQKKLIQSLSNGFEPIVYKAYPEVKALRDGMLELGCLSANISGSGPTLYGITTSLAEAVSIEANFVEWHRLQNDLSQVKVDTWTARSVDFGTTIINPN
ncbi:MAG: 4-(cytidine 5'-diphospho)-2-C-methyl-D-erythritol kinase [Candidatus Obscuribacterales bacterium]|nr:4-(cytidine 5'-diphospho)-2-C-methyl-D-erythritol kinase [Candidatus Obscuribacterales bacterium]